MKIFFFTSRPVSQLMMGVGGFFSGSLMEVVHFFSQDFRSGTYNNQGMDDFV